MEATKGSSLRQDSNFDSNLRYLVQIRMFQMKLEKGVPLMFKVSDVAEILRVSRGQVYALLRGGDLESHRIRGARRISERQLLDYFRSIGEL